LLGKVVPSRSAPIKTPNGLALRLGYLSGGDQTGLRADQHFSANEAGDMVLPSIE
jgi:hypothetical protein